MSADDIDVPSEDWTIPALASDAVQRFKWGWNKLHGASVWKVSGPGDGHPYHEEQLKQAWGRELSPDRGDILGAAILSPATESSKALLTISAYYRQQVPPAIVRWFEHAYPEARQKHS